MKVVGIIGSPRRGGNTEILVEQVLAGAATAGAETQVFRLNELNIRGCQACNHCKEHGSCRQQDDMRQIYEEMLAADAIVIGSPIYMGYFTAQTKLFMDRLYAFFRPGAGSTLPKGKRLAVVYSQGGGDDREFVDALARRLAGIIGVELKGVVGGNGMNELGIAKENKELMEQAFRLGEELVR